MRNELQSAIDRLEENVEYLEEVIDDQTTRSMVRDEALKDIPAFTVALSAIRDALKRSEGCEYCEKEKRIKNAFYTNAFAEVCKHSKSFAVHMPLNFGSADCDFFINYCPMCGRKLEEEG